MAIEVGIVKSIVGTVKAVDTTGAERILTVGSPVFADEQIQTADSAQVLIDLKQGSDIVLGRLMSVTLDADVIGSADTPENSAMSLIDLEQAIAAGTLNEIDLDALQETAAGEDVSSSVDNPVVIARLGLTGEVTNGFDTSGLNGTIASPVERDAVGGIPPTPTQDLAPRAFINDDGKTLLGLIGADYQTSQSTGIGNLITASSTLFGGSGNTPIELGVADIVDYKPGKAFRVEDNGENDIDHTTMSVDNGLGEDLLGLDAILGHEEFVAPSDPAYDDYKYTKNSDGSMTVSRKDGQPMSADEANYAMGGVETKDTSLLGVLLNSGVGINRTHKLYVEDSSGQSDTASQTQFVSAGLLSGGLLDIPVLNILDPLLNNVEDALAPITGPVFGLVGDVLDLVDNLTDPLAPILGPVGDLLNNIGSGLGNITDALSDTILGDPTVGNAVADLGGALTDPLINSDKTLDTLIGDEGKVDQLVGQVTNLVDGLVGTDLSAIDKPLDNVTTDLDEFLKGNDDLSETVSNLLNENGSVDQVIAGVTDAADDLLGTDLSSVDLPVDHLTTDVDNLLNGSQGLSDTVSNLLNENGSVDQVIAGVTDAADDLLGTDLSSVDLPVDHLTTDVDNLLNGSQGLSDTVSNLLNENGSVDQVIAGVTDAADDLLGTDLSSVDLPVDHLTTDIDNLLNGSQGLSDTVSNLLNENGSVDQVIAGVTDAADDLLGTDLSSVDLPVDHLTTDVDNLLNGSQGLSDTVSNLLNENGSVDQVIAGVTDAADDLLGTDLSSVDLPVDHLTTDVDNLLNGSQSLTDTTGNLLGEAGSVDQVVAGVTEAVDDLLGTDLGTLDQPVDEVTTAVNDLLTGGSGSLLDTLTNNPTDALSSGVSSLVDGASGLLSGSDSLLNEDGQVDQLIDEVTDLADGLLGTDLGAIDLPEDHLTTDIDNLLNGSQSLGETTGNLLGPVGSVDQVVAGVTDAADDLLGSDLSAVDQPVDNLTTDLNDFLNGDQGLQDTLGNLLNVDGSVDQVVGGVTTAADDLLGTSLSELDQPLDNVTTDIDNLLQGATLGETTGSLLGPVGSVDQVVDGATTALDDLLGTDLGALDNPVDNLTTDLDDYLNGQQGLEDTVVNLLGDTGSVDQVVSGVTTAADDLLGLNLSSLDSTVDNVTTEVSKLVGSLL